MGPRRSASRGVFRLSTTTGSHVLFERAIASARSAADAAERHAVAHEVDELIGRSGLTSSAFAERIGTSASGLSTYRHGKVTPSEALLVRMRHLVDRIVPPGGAATVAPIGRAKHRAPG